MFKPLSFSFLANPGVSTKWVPLVARIVINFSLCAAAGLCSSRHEHRASWFSGARNADDERFVGSRLLELHGEWQSAVVPREDLMSFLRTQPKSNWRRHLINC